MPMAEPKTASAESPWPLRILLAVLVFLAAGVAQAAGADLWEIIKSLVQAVTG